MIYDVLNVGSFHYVYVFENTLTEKYCLKFSVKTMFKRVDFLKKQIDQNTEGTFQKAYFLLNVPYVKFAWDIYKGFVNSEFSNAQYALLLV